MTLRLARLWLASGLFAAAPGLLAQLPPSPVTRPQPPVLSNMSNIGVRPVEMVDSFKLSDVDIDAVLGALETYTGKTIIRPGQLPTASYSLKISRPIPKTELVTALETILELNQVSVTPMGDRFLKVTALSTAKSETPEMITGSSLDLPPSGRIVTKLFELSFLRVGEFVPQIQSFMTPGVASGIVQLEKANVAMVTDTLENIQRIERLLNEVDKPREGTLVPKFYTLKNGAKAADVVTRIHSMLSGPAGTQLRATTSYTPDDRTNQIIVIADPREYPLFDSLIAQLDIKSDPYTRMEVIPLKHGDAKDVATLLSAVISGQTSAVKSSSSQSVRPYQLSVPGQAQAPVPAATPATPTASASGSAEAGTSEFSSFITVQPDERTNSVVVSGTFDDIRLIKGIIDKIDVLLAQVSIQVVIAEVTLSDTDDNGLSALGLTVGKAPNGGTSITNFSGTISGWTVASGIPNPLSFMAALQSAGDKHKVKILQQDTITTTHNKEASFVASQQVPIITGSTGLPLSTGTTGGFATTSTVSYQDIGITLKVTPLIGDDGSVQLKIDQKVDDNEGSVIIDNNSQPIIGHREATAFINCQDGEMVVLGGLQSAGRTIDKQKLGLLYELPIISSLLGYRTADVERTELLLFIRPHVLQPSEQTADTKKMIDGMGNSTQIRDYLKDPTRMPDPQETLRDKLD
jgi:general secretion pathway protein D